MISVCDEDAVRIRPAIAEELPRVSYFANLVEIQIGYDQRVLVARRLRHKLPARIAEVTLTIELANVPRLLVTDAIDRANEVTVCNCVCRLFQPPQVFGESSHCGRGIENDLGAVQTECARAFGEVAIVADVNSDACESRVKTRVTEIAGPKVKLLPKARIHVRDVVLAILAEVLAIRVDHRGGVVIDPGEFLFIDRHDDDHAVFLSDFLHQPHGWTIRNTLDRFIPARLLFGAEVRSREDLLHAEYLHALLRGLLDEVQVLLDVEAFDLLDRQVGRRCIRTLNKCAFNRAWHEVILPSSKRSICRIPEQK